MNPKMLAADMAQFRGISLQGIHKQLKSNNFKTEKSQNRVFFGHETSRELLQIPYKNKIVAIQIVKGGTGKSSLAHAVAVRASLYGARVLCIDLDQQGNLTEGFGFNADKTPVMVDVIDENIPIEKAIVSIAPGIDLLPSRIENSTLDNTIMLKRLPLDRVYRDRFDSLRGKYDFIIIDCPPALGQSVAAVALATDVIVSPVTPEKYCLSGLRITSQEIINIEETYKKKIEKKIVLNKYDQRTVLSIDTMTLLLKHPTFGPMMCKSYIRLSQEFPNSTAAGASIYDTLRNTPAKEDIDLLTQELLGLDAYLSKSAIDRRSAETELMNHQTGQLNEATL